VEIPAAALAFVFLLSFRSAAEESAVVFAVALAAAVAVAVAFAFCFLLFAF
jgi:hypothetical protein